jgi:hypothetical protein
MGYQPDSLFYDAIYFATTMGALLVSAFVVIQLDARERARNARKRTCVELIQNGLVFRTYLAQGEVTLAPDNVHYTFFDLDSGRRILLTGQVIITPLPEAPAPG